ncbi:MAG: helix-turn-helix transcriptional regulator [Archaeoglobaceae archaeon]
MKRLTWLQAKRIEAGYTLEELAKKLGIHPSYLSRIENYTQKLSRRLLAKYCELLGITEEDYRSAFWNNIMARISVEMEI